MYYASEWGMVSCVEVLITLNADLLQCDRYVLFRKARGCDGPVGLKNVDLYWGYVQVVRCFIVQERQISLVCCIGMGPRFVR